MNKLSIFLLIAAQASNFEPDFPPFETGLEIDTLADNEINNILNQSPHTSNPGNSIQPGQAVLVSGMGHYGIPEGTAGTVVRSRGQDEYDVDTENGEVTVPAKNIMACGSGSPDPAKPTIAPPPLPAVLWRAPSPLTLAKAVNALPVAAWRTEVAEHLMQPLGPQASGLVGLQNRSNICFMNAILQVLSQTQFMQEWARTWSGTEYQQRDVLASWRGDPALQELPEPQELLEAMMSKRDESQRLQNYVFTATFMNLMKTYLSQPPATPGEPAAAISPAHLASLVRGMLRSSSDIAHEDASEALRQILDVLDEVEAPFRDPLLLTQGPQSRAALTTVYRNVGTRTFTNRCHDHSDDAELQATCNARSDFSRADWDVMVSLALPVEKASDDRTGEAKVVPTDPARGLLADRRGERLLTQLVELDPKASREDYFDGTEWDFIALEQDLRLSVENNERGERLLARLMELDPEAKRKDYFDGTKWDTLELELRVHNSLTLKDLLDKHYLGSEHVAQDADDAVKCEFLQQRGQPSKVASTSSRKIYATRDVIILSLGRFKNVRIPGTSPPQYHRTKIQRPVQIPTILDVQPYLHPTSQQTENSYRLTGVVNHSGRMEGGHYTANLTSLNNNQWYLANDRRVSPTDGSNVLSDPSAYILFYTRVRSTPPLPPSISASDQKKRKADSAERDGSAPKRARTPVENNAEQSAGFYTDGVTKLDSQEYRAQLDDLNVRAFRHQVEESDIQIFQDRFVWTASPVTRLQREMASAHIQSPPPAPAAGSENAVLEMETNLGNWYGFISHITETSAPKSEPGVTIPFGHVVQPADIRSSDSCDSIYYAQGQVVFYWQNGFTDWKQSGFFLEDFQRNAKATSKQVEEITQGKVKLPETSSVPQWIRKLEAHRQEIQTEANPPIISVKRNVNFRKKREARRSRSARLLLDWKLLYEGETQIAPDKELLPDWLTVAIVVLHKSAVEVRKGCARQAGQKLFEFSRGFPEHLQPSVEDMREVMRWYEDQTANPPEQVTPPAPIAPPAANAPPEWVQLQVHGDEAQLEDDLKNAICISGEDKDSAVAYITNTYNVFADEAQEAMAWMRGVMAAKQSDTGGSTDPSPSGDIPNVEMYDPDGHWEWVDPEAETNVPGVDQATIDDVVPEEDQELIRSGDAATIKQYSVRWANPAKSGDEPTTAKLEGQPAWVSRLDATQQCGLRDSVIQEAIRGMLHLGEVRLSSWDTDVDFVERITAEFNVSTIEAIETLVWVENLRSGERATKSPTATPPLEPDLPDLEETWSCRACTFVNPATASVCEMCRTPSPQHDKGANGEGGTSAPLKVGGEGWELIANDGPTPAQWSCPACTYLNQGPGVACEMCGTAKTEDQENLGILKWLNNTVYHTKDDTTYWWNHGGKWIESTTATVEQREAAPIATAEQILNVGLVLKTGAPAGTSASTILVNNTTRLENTIAGVFGRGAGEPKAGYQSGPDPATNPMHALNTTASSELEGEPSVLDSSGRIDKQKMREYKAWRTLHVLGDSAPAGTGTGPASKNAETGIYIPRYASGKEQYSGRTFPASFNNVAPSTHSSTDECNDNEENMKKG